MALESNCQNIFLFSRFLDSDGRCSVDRMLRELKEEAKSVSNNKEKEVKLIVLHVLIFKDN